MANNRNDNRGNQERERDSMGRFTDEDGGSSSGRSDNQQSGRGGNQQGGRGGNQQGGNQQSGNRGNPDQPRDEEGRFTDDDSGSGRGGSRGG